MFKTRKHLLKIAKQLAQVRFCSDTTPRRSILYVPGQDKEKLAKLSSIEADCVCLDLEDTVAYNRKLEARDNVQNLLLKKEQLNPAKGYELAVRINSVETPFYRYDLNAILSGEKWPGAILLPKCDTVDQLAMFANETRQYKKGSSFFNLILLIESAQSVVELSNIVKAAFTLERRGSFRLVCLAFGADDFIADVGAYKSNECTEILYARQKIVVTAKAFNLQAVDLACIQYDDALLLEKQSLEGARLGFTGKQIVHPRQIPIVHSAYLPSPEKIEWARSLLEAFDDHRRRGIGVFIFRGVVIELSTKKQAEYIMKLAEMETS